MKKILFIAHDDLSGGSSRSLLSQILILKSTYDVYPIVVTWGENSLTEKLRKEHIEVHPLKFDFTSVWTRNRFFHFVKRPLYRFGYNERAFRRLKDEIDFSKIALLVSNSSVIDFGAYLHRKIGIPHVWFLREFGDADFNILSYVGNLPKYIEKNSTAIVCVSRAVADHWSMRGIDSKIDVVYNGVNVRSPNAEKELVDEKIRICMCGRLNPSKGQESAVKAMALLPEYERLKFQLDLWGKGESECRLKSLVKKLKLTDCVFLKGFSNDLNRELPRYDIGFNLSFAEAFGRTTVEYMAHSLYVVGCNSGGTPEVLKNGQYGSLVDVDCPDQIVHFLRAYLRNPGEYKRVARESQKYALKEFAPEKNAAQVMDVYQVCWRDC